MKVRKLAVWFDPFAQSIKLQRHYVSWHWRVTQGLKTNWLLVPKITWGIWWILMRAVARWDICTFMYYLWQQHIKFQPKKYRRIVSHDTEKRSKLWRKTDFYLKNDMRNLVNFNLSSGKSEKLHFYRKYVMFELKRYRRVVLCKMTYGFKNDISNLVNLHTSSSK